MCSRGPSPPTGARGHGLVQVAALIPLPPPEEILQQILDLGDVGGTADQRHVVHLGLVRRGVVPGLLQPSEGEVSIEPLKAGPRDGCVEVHTLVEQVDMDGRLGGGAEGLLGSAGAGMLPLLRSDLAPLLLVQRAAGLARAHGGGITDPWAGT